MRMLVGSRVHCCDITEGKSMLCGISLYCSDETCLIYLITNDYICDL